MWQTIMCASSMRPMCGTGTWILSCASGPELAAVAPGQRDGLAARLIRVLHGAQHVRRIAGTADAHEQVAGLGEVLELLGEDAVVAHVVGISGQRGQLVRQRHDAEARFAVEARALHDVAGEMRGGGGAAAVAADEDVLSACARFFEPLDGLVHLRQVDRVDRLQQVRLVSFSKVHMGSFVPASASAP